MKPSPFLLLSSALLAMSSIQAHETVMRSRSELHIPDVPGYVTLKGDFHIHTVFSDGAVWPSVRPDEAWREGLDAIAITDHLEYQPHKADLPSNHDRAYEIARDASEGLDVIVIKGSEITRSMPPGHINAIFLNDSEALDTETWQESIAEAGRQGAFIFWNHPGWSRQLYEGRIKWYQEHTDVLADGILHGIEVVNEREYYPEAHRWALEKGLTMMSNSDIHAPIHMNHDVHNGDHRALTLVFAKERSAEGIKEALFDRRTAVYSGDRLIGDERFLKPIFEGSVEVATKQPVRLVGKKRTYVQLRNVSDLEFHLELAEATDGVAVSDKLILPARKTILLEVKGTSDIAKGKRTLKPTYRVTNMLVGVDEPLSIDLQLKTVFVPKP